MSTQPFRIIAADHTGITVTNLERSLTFWRDVLGFQLSHRPHQTGKLASEITGVPGAEISIAVLKGYGHKIELLEYLAPSDRKAQSRSGPVMSVPSTSPLRSTILMRCWRQLPPRDGKPPVNRRPWSRDQTPGNGSSTCAIPTALRSNSCSRRLTRVDRSEMHADFPFGWMLSYFESPAVAKHLLRPDSVIMVSRL